MFENKITKLTNERKNLLLNFQKRAKIHFKDLNLLNLAFIHRSSVNELGKVDNGHTSCNERLEFLGDAVLDMVVASYLYKNLPDKSEGVLSQVKSLVVSENSLAQVGEKLGVGECLVLGYGEEKTGGRTKKPIIADCVESVIGAVYLDQGFAIAEKYTLSIITDRINAVLKNHEQKDAKSILQEWYQQKAKKCPVYVLEKSTGPDHEKTFWVSVHLGQKVIGPESGKSKKEAEQNVARLALEELAVPSTVE